MPKQSQDKFGDIPKRIASPLSMDNPNEPIRIYSGDFILRNQSQTYNMTGEIEFRWLPQIHVRFWGEIRSDVNPMPSMIDEYDLIIGDQTAGNALLTNIKESVTAECAGIIIKNFSLGEKDIPIEEVTFVVPNMREFFGEQVREAIGERINLQRSRINFSDKLYNITLDKVSDFNKRKKKLQNHGGYLITYNGKITKKKGSINLSEVHKWHDRFHHFLYFLNGRRVAPMFYTGVYESNKLWTDYTGYTIDTYKYVDCWSDISCAIELSGLWKSYNRLWINELDRDFLITVIHWYVEANSQAGKMEGSIILIQTALELIYNWLIVENQKIIIGKDADALSASNKIRLLILQFKIKPAIPPAFEALAKVPDVVDGPEAIVKIRNALVHGQEVKRKELKSITLKAQHDALQLGVWYVELALLYILRYSGKYKNRASGKQWKDTGELVPWTNDKSFKIGKPSDFTREEISDFIELLEKQNKVDSPSEYKVRRCKLIGIGFSWGKPISIGAIKPKTASAFKSTKANLPELAEDYDWEVGYLFTEPDYQGKGFSSTILNEILHNYGNGRLMASTEIREGNTMIKSLEGRGFKQVGNKWKSIKSGNDLRLFLRDKQE